MGITSSSCNFVLVTKLLTFSKFTGNLAFVTTLISLSSTDWRGATVGVVFGVGIEGESTSMVIGGDISAEDVIMGVGDMGIGDTGTEVEDIGVGDWRHGVEDIGVGDMGVGDTGVGVIDIGSGYTWFCISINIYFY